MENLTVKLGKNCMQRKRKDEFDLTSRAIDSIIYNMVGRFESIKELEIL